ncbi:MAG TPA: ATP-binding domain-containing protein [Candidatus Limiplasma stercoravium]|nr:ATP-binding domain-containing protein [Candidatus Limiplasma stercoravium]
MELLEVYAEFWRDLARRDPQDAPAAGQTLALLDKKRVSTEDLPALLLLARGLYGLTRLDVRHVVVDEAQDASPLQIRALREVFGHDAFTLAGDLCQGIYGDEGLRRWSDLDEGVFSTPPVLTRLSTAYRSTVEIMQVAFGVLARHPVPDVGQSKPVLRHGRRPSLLCMPAGARVDAVERQARAWLEEGYAGIAVVVKRPADARRLHAALVKRMPQARWVNSGEEEFCGGVQVLDAGMVKGLEFDGVIIADAEDAVYPDERFYAKLFYVLCTRALHRLCFVCAGAPAKHLQGAALDEETISPRA